MNTDEITFVQVALGIVAYFTFVSYAVVTFGPRMWRRMTIDGFRRSIAYHEEEAARLLRLAVELERVEVPNTDERDRAKKHIETARRRQAEMAAELERQQKAARTTK